MSEEKSITIKKSDLWKYSTLLLLAVVVIGGFFAFSGGSPNGNVVDNTGDSELVKASVDDDAVLGDANAPVTIIEFSDYQCIFCRKFWTETLPEIKTQYIDTGKVKFVYRDLPIPSLHPAAQASAEAAECVRDVAGTDEAYFEYHDKMFEEQNLLNPSGTVSYTSADLKEWAQEIGYDISSCLDSGKFKSEVLKDISAAQTAGFQGTPGFVIMKSGESEGTALKGAYPFSSFQQAIDAYLA
jgi:protein-disulfide isomerase